MIISYTYKRTFVIIFLEVCYEVKQYNYEHLFYHRNGVVINTYVPKYVFTIQRQLDCFTLNLLNFTFNCIFNNLVPNKFK